MTGIGTPVGVATVNGYSGLMQILSVASEFFSVFYHIVLPILLLVGLGLVLKRWFGLDMHTLKTINFYATLPTVVFLSVVSSEVSLREVSLMAGSITLLMLIQGAATAAYAAVRRVRSNLRPTMMLSTSIGNLGNFGLPLQELAFRSVGATDIALGYHAYLLVTNNFLTFTAGVLVASGAGGGGKKWKQMLKFPPLYALVAGIVVSIIRTRFDLPLPGVGSPLRPFWDVLVQLRSAFVTIALITLGAQLGTLEASTIRYPIVASVVLRLLAGPVIAMGVILLFGLEGVMAQVFMLTAASPAAVNTVLLAMEFDREPDFASRVVFYSTVLSPVSVTLVLLLMRSGILGVFAW